MTRTLIVLAAITVAIVFGLPTDLVAQTVWNGLVSTSWIEGGNWNGGAPPAVNGGAELADVTPNDTCIFDRTTALQLRDLRVAGASPTRMTFNLDVSAMNVTSLTEFENYAALDIDQNFDSDSDTDVSGYIWIDVENGKTMYLKSRVDVIGTGTTTLDLSDNTSGIFKANNVYIDAHTLNFSLGLKLVASNSLFTVLTTLQLNSSQDADLYRAKLWVQSGTLTIGSSTTTGTLDVNGGSTVTKSAEIDLDDAMSAEVSDLSGYVEIDVASGKTFYGGEMTFSGNGYYKKSGSGAVRSGPTP